MLTIPFRLKNATFSRERSSSRRMLCSYNNIAEQMPHPARNPPRHPEGFPHAEIPRDGVEPLLPVELDVLEGVEYVEPGHPEQDREGEDQDPRVDPPRDGDPGGQRRRTAAHPQDNVGRPSEARRGGAG